MTESGSYSNMVRAVIYTLYHLFIDCNCTSVDVFLLSISLPKNEFQLSKILHHVTKQSSNMMARQHKTRLRGLEMTQG